MKILTCVLTAILLMGCTMTFQNIDTHGTATDLVDENLSTTPTVNTSANIPIPPWENAKL